MQKQTEKKERKELTEEQKAKKAEKQAKRREYFEKKRQERLENGVKEEESGKESAANGDSAKQSQWGEGKEWSNDQLLMQLLPNLWLIWGLRIGWFDIFVLVLIFRFEFASFYTLQSPYFLQTDYV